MVWYRPGHKYNAKKVKLDGYTFDSKAEARRYGELKLRQAAGEIGSLDVHPKYEIPGNAFDIPHVCNVILDFVYWDVVSEQYKHEDVKGIDTPISRLKRKLLLAFYGIKVEVIK